MFRTVTSTGASPPSTIAAGAVVAPYVACVSAAGTNAGAAARSPAAGAWSRAAALTRSIAVALGAGRALDPAARGGRDKQQREGADPSDHDAGKGAGRSRDAPMRG